MDARRIAEIRELAQEYQRSNWQPVNASDLIALCDLVTVDGHDYEIADIGLRMLTPRELFRAQGFPESYVIDRGADGRKLPKDAQVRLCGNSVCPPIACAIVAANCGRLIQHEREAAAA